MRKRERNIRDTIGAEQPVSKPAARSSRLEQHTRSHRPAPDRNQAVRDTTDRALPGHQAYSRTLLPTGPAPHAEVLLVHNRSTHCSISRTHSVCIGAAWQPYTSE